MYTEFTNTFTGNKLQKTDFFFLYTESIICSNVLPLSTVMLHDVYNVTSYHKYHCLFNLCVTYLVTW